MKAYEKMSAQQGPKVFRATMCEGKEKFTEFTRAQETARRVANRHKAPVQAYKCKCCGFFHVGGRTKRRDER